MTSQDDVVAHAGGFKFAGVRRQHGSWRAVLTLRGYGKLYCGTYGDQVIAARVYDELYSLKDLSGARPNWDVPANKVFSILNPENSHRHRHRH